MVQRGFKKRRGSRSAGFPPQSKIPRTRIAFKKRAFNIRTQAFVRPALSKVSSSANPAGEPIS
jgi:hypothetical protein